MEESAISKSISTPLLVNSTFTPIMITFLTGPQKMEDSDNTQPHCNLNPI